MIWEYDQDLKTWECWSQICEEGYHHRWCISVTCDGKFDVNHSSEALCNGVAAFETLAIAKAFCEASEAASVAIDATESHSEKAIYQCHWLNPVTNETIWLSQTDGIETFEQLSEWINQSRKNACEPCPDGWDVLICTQDSEYFACGPKQEAAELLRKHGG